MRKILLSSVLTSAFIIPAFCASQIDDSNDEQFDSVATSQTSKQKVKVNNHPHKKIVEEKEDDDLKTNVMGMHRKNQKNNPNLETLPPSEKYSHNEVYTAKAKEHDSEDDNPNLANLTTPEENIRSNLSISGEDAALSRQMMLNGPQGGIQNNQPPGIGGTSANF